MHRRLRNEATAKRDLANRLRTLALDLSLHSDKAFLLRRAQQAEREASALEIQALDVSNSVAPVSPPPVPGHLPDAQDRE
jgi:hypothetical protein